MSWSADQGRGMPWLTELPSELSSSEANAQALQIHRFCPCLKAMRSMLDFAVPAFVPFLPLFVDGVPIDHNEPVYLLESIRDSGLLLNRQGCLFVDRSKTRASGKHHLDLGRKEKLHEGLRLGLVLTTRDGACSDPERYGAFLRVDKLSRKARVSQRLGAARTPNGDDGLPALKKLGHVTG